MSLATLVVVALGAVLAPVIAEILPVTVPVVVLEIVAGIVGGPVLGIAKADALLHSLAGLGMGFLFFLAGREIDLSRIAGRPLALAVGGWAMSLSIAFAVAAILERSGMAIPIEFVAVALCTTALGTLLPMMHDARLLPTPFGRHAVAAGISGELFPVILLSVLLTGRTDKPLAGALLIAFSVVAVACAFAAKRVRLPWLSALLGRSMRASSQLPVRLSMLLLVALAYLAEDLGLDVILGAFAAGMVVRLASGPDATVLEDKLEAIGFGFLVPVFFVTTGLTFDLDALTGDPTALLALPVFLLAVLVVRGAPALLYRRELDGRDRLGLALCSSTTLPLIVAITAIAQADGYMSSQMAAALVGAGMLSVLLFPALALAVRSRGAVSGPTPAHTPLGA
jgi:Kef-type K+ transport system membrane component KefB